MVRSISFDPTIETLDGYKSKDEGGRIDLKSQI
jgi:hypothetical protein